MKLILLLLNALKLSEGNISRVCKPFVQKDEVMQVLLKNQPKRDFFNQKRIQQQPLIHDQWDIRR